MILQISPQIFEKISNTNFNNKKKPSSGSRTFERLKYSINTSFKWLLRHLLQKGLSKIRDPMYTEKGPMFLFRPLTGYNLKPDLRDHCGALWFRLFFLLILCLREWELLLNLQEEINARRKGPKDSHLYPKSSPVSEQGTSNAKPFRTLL
jgi:hypothetical protein